MVASGVVPECPRPSLAVTYFGDHPGLLERLVPLVDAIEIAPDAIARSDQHRSRLREEVVAELAALPPDVALIADGVGLSIGSFDHWQPDYLQLLDQLLSQLEVVWHSEHLSYSLVAGENLGTMLCLPRTEEALDLVCRRVEAIQQRYPIPFLLEHVISLLPEPAGRYSTPEFLNEITSRTGCGLILDAYNLRCDAHNQNLDIPRFLDDLDLSSVVEVHIAGGVQRDGFQLDVHSRISQDETLSVAREVVQRAPAVRAVTFEYLKEVTELLGYETICDELVRIRHEVLQ